MRAAFDILLGVVAVLVAITSSIDGEIISFLWIGRLNRKEHPLRFWANLAAWALGGVVLLALGIGQLISN